MAYRYLEDIDEKIINAIIKIGADEGVQKVSAQKIAAICDISTYTVFDHFKTKRNFIESAAQYFEDKYLSLVTDQINQKKSVYEIWDFIIEEFVKNPDESLYYLSYINIFGFDPSENNVKSDIFLKIAKGVFSHEHNLTNNQLLIVWDFLSSMAFYYSEKFIHNFLPYNDETKNLIKSLVFNGVDNVLK